MTAYHFVGRSESRYYWEKSIPGDSRCIQVSCSIDWFWQRPVQGEFMRYSGAES